MKTRIKLVPILALTLTLIGATWMMATQAGPGHNVPPPRPKGPCDIYAAAGDPCVAAHSTTRALYASYDGPLYRVLRQSDGKTQDIGVVRPVASTAPDAGGYANAAAQDAFCANTYCWITTIYDQSPKHNDLTQAPRGGFSGPAMGGFNNIPLAGMAAGDTISIDIGSNVETRKVASIGTAAGNPTTLWQPLPDGPVITIPAGSTSVPVTSVNGFAVGEKIGIGYGATYPAIAKALERYEVVTVTAVGKQGTQAFLERTQAGATNIKVTSVANISVGDKIRLDIESVGHGIETVTVTRVGTQSGRTALTADVAAGATTIKVRNVNGFAAGAQVSGTGITLTSALTKAHAGGTQVAGSIPTPGAPNQYYRKGPDAKK